MSQEISIGPRRVFFLPWQGEFGIYISTFIRAVHHWPAEFKAVACRAGERCLFPTASAFFHDSVDFVPDRKRIGRKNTPWVENRLNELREEICRKRPEFLDYEFVMPFMKYNCYKSERALVTARFSPAIQRRGLTADVVITPRKRELHRARNLPCWQEIADRLVQLGFTVGAVGRAETSFPIAGTLLNSWDYPDIDACIEMMQNAKIVIASNCGLAHLAVFLRVPMVLMRNSGGMICWMEEQRDKEVLFKLVEPTAAGALDAVLPLLQGGLA